MDKQEKKVSIVIPLYKSERFLEKLLDSIIGQTYKNLEIILVDDGSPDNSGKIADCYAERDKRITVIHKKNGGTCEARNTGLAAATGEYLMFADGDDWIENDCVEYLVKILEENNAQMSTTDCVFTTRNRVQSKKDSVSVWNNKQAVAGIINTIIPVGPWNKLYTLSSIREHNVSFSVPWFGEGLYFSTMAAMYSDRVAVGHRKVYNYRLNNTNSGCTRKEPKNAINALNNIIYIKRHLVVDCPEIQQALDWHIWTNNFMRVLYIISADAKASYSKEYAESRSALWQLMPRALKNKELSPKLRFKIVMETLFPVAMARLVLWKEKLLLKKDTME